MSLTKRERKALRRQRRMELKSLRKARAMSQKKHYANSDTFLLSYEWRRVRMEVLKRYGTRCACCGATPADGVRMHVDHIKPRRDFPSLALDKSNLQVLCEVCNHGKGNWDQTDWRAPALDVGHEAEEERQREHLRSILYAVK